MALAISTTDIPIMWSGVANNSTHKISVTGRVGNATINVLNSDESLPPGITVQQPSAGSNDAFLVGMPTVLPTSKEQYFIAFQAVDDNGTSPIVKLFICLAEAPNTAKIAVAQIADSRGGEPGLPYESMGWKPNMQRLLGDTNFQFYGLQNVRFGQQTTTLRNKVPTFTQPIYNASRPMNIAKVLGGHLNDLQSNPSITAQQVAQRYQDLVNDLQAIGFKAIASCAGAGNFVGVGTPPTDMDTLVRKPANEIIRGNAPLISPSTYFSADAIEDMGGQTEFNSLPVTSNTQWYRDGIHYSWDTYRYKLCVEDTKAIAKLPSIPLTAIFDIKSKYLVGEDIVPFSVIPMPETGTKSWVWKVGSTTKATVQNPVASDFAGLGPGDYTMTLEVTQSGNTVTASKVFTVTLAGNVGGGALTPEDSLIAEGSHLDLTASGVGSTPIFRVRSGPGFLNNLSGVNARYNDVTPHGTALIEAAKDAWESITPSNGSINANQEWVKNVAGTPTAQLYPRMKDDGSGMDAEIPANFQGQSALGFFETATGKQWKIRADNKLVEYDGTTTTTTTISTLTAGEILRLKLETVAGNKVVHVYRANTLLHTFTVLRNGALDLVPFIYADNYTTTYKRPDFFGTITNWAAGVALVRTVTDVTPPDQMVLSGATVIAADAIEVAFATPIDDFGVAGIKVQRSTSADFSTDLVEWDNQSQISPFTDSSCQTNIARTFYYRAKAKDTAGLYSLNWSNTVSVLQDQLTPIPLTSNYTPNTGLTAPVTLTFDDVTAGVVTDQRISFGDYIKRSQTDDADFAHTYLAPGIYKFERWALVNGVPEYEIYQINIGGNPPTPPTGGIEFDEIELNRYYAEGAMGGPVFSTSVLGNPDGVQQRNANRPFGLHEYELNFEGEDQSKPEFAEFLDFFQTRQGRLIGFRFFPFVDNRWSNEEIAKTNTSTAVYRLIRTYKKGGRTLTRRIVKPCPDLVVTINGNPASTYSPYTIDYSTGKITFTTPAGLPSNGSLRVTGFYCLPVVFADDKLNMTGFTCYADLNGLKVVELPFAALGITD